VVQGVGHVEVACVAVVAVHPYDESRLSRYDVPRHVDDAHHPSGAMVVVGVSSRHDDASCQVFVIAGGNLEIVTGGIPEIGTGGTPENEICGNLEIVTVGSLGSVTCKTKL